MNLLLILGTAHSLQIGSISNNTQDDRLFKMELESLCLRHNISLIAEEMSDEALRRTENSQTIGRIVASEQNIAHLFCDPPSRVRSELGIRDTQTIRLDAILEHWENSREVEELERSWSLREDYMLGCIKSAESARVLLICGANHVEGLAAKAEAMAFPVTIAHRDWEPNNVFNTDAGKAHAD